MKNINFEETLKELEGIVQKLEVEELSLDDSLKIFEEGIALYRQCSNELNKIEKKIHIIIEENEELKKVPFLHDEEEA